MVAHTPSYFDVFVSFIRGVIVIEGSAVTIVVVTFLSSGAFFPSIDGFVVEGEALIKEEFDGMRSVDLKTFFIGKKLRCKAGLNRNNDKEDGNGKEEVEKEEEDDAGVERARDVERLPKKW